MTTLHDLKTKIFCDGVRDAAHLKEILARYPVVQGFTTNPSLMRKAGVTDYKRWAKELLGMSMGLPISFEVVADQLSEMVRQALILAEWGSNVVVKIPIMTTTGQSTHLAIDVLADHRVNLNVTALLTDTQVLTVAPYLRNAPISYISVFAGRIADTGRDPLPIMRLALRRLQGATTELIWASPREILNVWQANEIGCHIITVPPEMLPKLVLAGRPLAEYSRETVKMFYEDAVKAGYTL